MPSWENLTDELAARLPYLRSGDTVTLWRNCYYVEFSQSFKNLAAAASGNYPTLPSEARLTADQQRRLAELGWRCPAADGPPNWWLPAVPWPMRASTARHLAELFTTTLRSAYGAASVEEITYSSFNDEGHPKPELATLARSRS